MNISRRAFATGTILCATSGIATAKGARQLFVKKAIPWWQTAVIYEIYPRSFQDSNGDGVGDFNGMESRIDYLASLGVDAIWVAACFDSPNADNGYDVRDYRKIMPDFGTMEDFDRFLKYATKKKIRIILDMVFNHTSDQHSWFVQSRSSRDNPYRNFYHWHNGKDGGPPTNWKSAFGGSAWAHDEETGQYYLHTFTAAQPDLNWENPQVRTELYSILKFWAQKGVSGFRFDAILCIAKTSKIEDISAADTAAGKTFFERGPRLNYFLHEMHMNVFSGTDLYAVGEGWGLNRQKEIIDITDSSEMKLSSVFRFNLQSKDIKDFWEKLPFELSDLRDFNSDNSFVNHPTTWPVVWLEDHDFPRSISRYGSQLTEFRERSAKLLAVMLLSLRGTPYIYQGQEIGMSNFPFHDISQFDDVSAHNIWKEKIKSSEISSNEIIQNLSATSRDNARTPMQWSKDKNSGFTSGDPWIQVNPNYRSINAQDQETNSASVLNFYKYMINIRKRNISLIFGDYTDLSDKNSSVYAYSRVHHSGNFLVVLNFSDKESEFIVPKNILLKKILVSNLEHRNIFIKGRLVLLPWESLIISI